jgi:hypothetical protein
MSASVVCHEPVSVGEVPLHRVERLVPGRTRPRCVLTQELEREAAEMLDQVRSAVPGAEAVLREEGHMNDGDQVVDQYRWLTTTT